MKLWIKSLKKGRRHKMAQVNLTSTLHTWCKNICQEVMINRKKTGINNGVRDYPGAAVIAADNSLAYSGRGRSCKPQHGEYGSTRKLENKLKSLGRIGEVRRESKNPIGACAEPHAARKVLTHFGDKMSLNQLVFSKALRPRTMETVEYCRNCKDTFPNL